MPDYLRWYQPGGSYFFTIVTYRRQPVVRDAEAVERLRIALRCVQTEWPFQIVGAVVLPDHLHFIWNLPPGDADYSRRIGRFKARFSASGNVESDFTSSRSRRKHRESSIWQRRFWEHTLRDEDDLKRHLDYIHYNPVKHGYAKCPHLWPYSSFAQWVDRGEYQASWGCQCRESGKVPPNVEDLTDSAGEP